jgi:UDP-hydrolysing UDP-N-acetyl-D-glucosamine 2-epimerase
VTRIGVFTGTRAEYGLLRPVLEAMELSDRLEPRLIVGGTHLSEAHGRTVSEIEADGRRVDATVPVRLARDDGTSVAEDMAATLAGAARAYAALVLDAVMVLGDRTEVLAAACAAVPLRLPILHLEGGHRTAGAIDDSIRHAVTKLAALHFTAAEPYRQRILQMGEAPERVFTVGSTGVDTLMALGRATPADIQALAGLDVSKGFVLATFHPETLGDRPAAEQIATFLAGLGGVANRPILMTQPNADAGSGAVRSALTAFAAERPGQVRLVQSLGARGYAAALTACDVVVGNSSSGVIEAPAAGVPSINVGARQDGRLKPGSVIDCALEPGAIRVALSQALTPAFRETARSQPPMFGDGTAGRRIVDILERTDLTGLARKPFVDRP